MPHPYNISKLREWVPEPSTDREWACLCLNTSDGAMELLEHDLINGSESHVNDIMVCWRYLSGNPSAIQLIEHNLDKVDFDGILENPSAIHLIKPHFPPKWYTKSMMLTSWNKLSKNSAAVTLLKKYPHIINRTCICANPAAIEIIKTYGNGSSIHWWHLSRNPSAVEMLEANLNKINWNFLSSNIRAIHLLEAHLELTHSVELSTNPSAIHLLKANPDKLHNVGILVNPAAINIIEAIVKNPNTIYQDINDQFVEYSNVSVHYGKACLYSNPAIFEIVGYHYDRIRIDRTQLNAELLTRMLHPQT